MNNNKNDNFDLDGLKKLWNDDMDLQSETQSFSNNQILTIMLQKTTSAVRSVQRNIIIEILLAIPIIIGGYFICIALGRPFPIPAWIALFILTCGYHVYLYWQLTKLPPNENTLISTVEKQLKEVKNIVKIYDYSAIIIGIVFFVIGILHVYPFTQKSLLLLAPQVFFSFFSGLGAFFATRWYSDKLYGQHYSTLLQSFKTLQSA
jgi:hypothetical protein